MSFQTYLEILLANIVQRNLGPVMARSATVAWSHFGTFMALSQDSFRYFQPNIFILYNMAIDHSCIKYTMEYFRQIITSFQVSPIYYKLLYRLFTFEWRLFDNSSSTFLSSVNIVTFGSLCPLSASIRPRHCRTWLFFLVWRQKLVMKLLEMCSGGSTVLAAGL